MSEIHIRRIKKYLDDHVCGLIDASDLIGKSQAEKDASVYSRSLAAFSLMVLAQCTADEAASSVTDGFDDNGIDAVLFDKLSYKLWIVQSKFSNKGTGSISHGDMLKFIKGVNDLLTPDFDKFNDKLKSHSKDIEDALDDSKVTIQIVSATTGPAVSKECKGSVDELLNEINVPTTIAYFHDFNLNEVVNGLLANVSGKPIDEDVLLTDWGMIDDPYKAVYGLMDGVELASLWRTHKKRLFSENIRSFLGTSDVNENISETIKNTPQNFVYFNNGITILCDSLTKKPHGGGDRHIGYFTCKNVSVVNGAQTIGTIGSTLENSKDEDISLKVFVKIISLENAPQDFGESITIATNTQNRVEKKDFISLDDEQIRLRREFALESITYHIKRSGEKIIQDEKNYTLEEATLSLATMWQDVTYSVIAKREIGKLWEDRTKKPYTELFSHELKATKLIKAIKVYRKVSEILRPKIANASGRERSIYVYGNLFITHMVFRLVPNHAFEGSLDFDKYLSNIIEPEIPSVIKNVHDKTMELYPNAMIPQLFRNFTKCRDIKDKLNIKVINRVK